ncbi:MAG: hypothetical protein IID41_00340 [Planctomycetes bacterium]|nr:hypothetical protein [Planctomycetota bacterium]
MTNRQIRELIRQQREGLLASSAVRRLVKDVGGWSQIKRVMQFVAGQSALCDCREHSARYGEEIPNGAHFGYCIYDDARKIAKRMRWKISTMKHEVLNPRPE